ncbi:MAG: tyrosine-protein phosphatase [Prevotella sp.]|nr:tyrosine-protein phosphatase [Prevotella sp.]
MLCRPRGGTLDLIDQQYGSLSAYIVNQLGFSEAEQQQLRAKYLTGK